MAVAGAGAAADADAAVAVHVSTNPFCHQFPPIPWGRWILMFEDWLMASGFPDIDPLQANVAARKAAILSSNLGAEGFRLYASLAVDVREPYANAVNRLRMHFDRPASFVFARAQFTRYLQRPGESVALFVSTLRE